jgi:hypothetical protein
MIINLRIYISPLCTEEQWAPTAPEANNETILLIVTAFLRPDGGRNAKPSPYPMYRTGAYPPGEGSSSSERPILVTERPYPPNEPWPGTSDDLLGVVSEQEEPDLLRPRHER